MPADVLSPDVASTIVSTAAGATPSDASSITTSPDEGSSTGCRSLGCPSLAGDVVANGLADGDTDGETPDAIHKSGTTLGITHESSTTPTGSLDDCAGGARTNDNPNPATTMQAKVRLTGTWGLTTRLALPKNSAAQRLPEAALCRP